MVHKIIEVELTSFDETFNVESPAIPGSAVFAFEEDDSTSTYILFDIIKNVNSSEFGGLLMQFPVFKVRGIG